MDTRVSNRNPKNSLAAANQIQGGINLRNYIGIIITAPDLTINGMDKAIYPVLGFSEDKLKSKKHIRINLVASDNTDIRLILVLVFFEMPTYVLGIKYLRKPLGTDVAIISRNKVNRPEYLRMNLWGQ